jgi:hypothetical protein
MSESDKIRLSEYAADGGKMRNESKGLFGERSLTGMNFGKLNLSLWREDVEEALDSAGSMQVSVAASAKHNNSS